MKNFIKHIVLSLFMLLSTNVFSQVLIDFYSQWYYFKGTTEPSNPYTDWVNPDFDYSGWSVGSAPFSYGYTEKGTQLTDMYSRYTTFYLRSDFQIADLNEIDEIKISAAFDDGIIIWINGHQVVKTYAPTYPVYNQFATRPHDAGEPEMYTISKSDADLHEGTNTVAIQGFNVSKTSNDFYIDTKFVGAKSLPETDPAICNTPSGFFTNPFTVQLTTEQPGEFIKYTLDGSDPGTSATAIQVVSPANITVNPNSTEANRGKTGDFVLRASHVKDGFSPSKPITRNYVFVSSVKTQQKPGGSWPVSNINGQVIDYVMDPNVTSDPRYQNLMETALLDIPSIFITTDLDNLFGSQNGIYVNAKYHGAEWERPANIELVNPDGSPGFNIDAGLRIRGGYSRHNNYPKHAFRLFFRSEYGEGKLKFPLFGDEGVSEFEKVDLRTSQNYSWANDGSVAKYNTMNRDVFSRDCQRDIGQPYTRSRYYHLYLDGLYWGVYQTQERGDANFAQSYLGGNKDDYDVVKVDIGENWNLYTIEATDGNTDAWQQVWDITQRGYSSNLNYFELIGDTPEGKADTSLTKWVDVDNLIDYMLTIFYGGNFDSPVSKFSGNKNPNNFFAIFNRNDKRQGFKFLAHDAEHTLLVDPAGPGVGLIENRVNIGHTSSNTMTVSSFSKFHPQWLHFKLSDNEEYRMRFADHVYRQFFNNGAFNPDSCTVRFEKTADKLDMAIIAESARWGDQTSYPARNKIDDWLPAVNQVINDWMPYRTDIVIGQLIDEGLYPEIDPPVFKKDGNEILNYKITLSNSYNFTIENQNSTGTIYYTTNGEDPRKIGGNVLESAIMAGNSQAIVANAGNHIMARVKSGNTWSALHELVFEDSNLFNNLKVTELNYHPADQGLVDGKDIEFIELKNIGNTTLDLSGLEFTEGIYFTFPEGSSIPPNSMIVIASNMEVFTSFYGFAPDFEFTGNLANSGEKIVLVTATGQIVLSFTYSDDDPRPKGADGNGYSLVSAKINPTGDPNSPDYWTTSQNLNGSPLYDDAKSVTGVNEIVYESAVDFSVYPNPSSDNVNIDFYLNSDANVVISLFDLNGRLIQSVTSEDLSSGYHNKSLQLSTLNIKAGVYLINFRTKTNSVTKKLIYNP